MRQPCLGSALLVLGAIASWACSGEDAAAPPGSDAELTVGYYTKDSFDDLQQVPDCPVLWGLQGGNWTMPTLRTQNFGPEATAEGKLELDGELLGSAMNQTELIDRMDGWQELTYLPIPVSHAPPNEAAPIDDIYGKQATLSFSLVDGSGRELEARYQVALRRSEVTE